MLYKIIKNHAPQVVVDRVNEEIKNGWTPLGGIAISTFGETMAYNFTNYAQAMVKE